MTKKSKAYNGGLVTKDNWKAFSKVFEPYHGDTGYLQANEDIVPELDKILNTANHMMSSKKS